MSEGTRFSVRCSYRTSARGRQARDDGLEIGALIYGKYAVRQNAGHSNAFVREVMTDSGDVRRPPDRNSKFVVVKGLEQVLKRLRLGRRAPARTAAMRAGPVKSFIAY